MRSSARKVVLSDSLRAKLSRETMGTGGYQALVQEIQRNLDGATLVVDDKLLERIEHYAYDYGSGGWQQLLRDLLGEIASAAQS